MTKLLSMPHYHTSREIAALLQTDPDVIDRLVRCRIHPCWFWKNHWREPRWASSTIPEWRHVLDNVDINALPENPPPLERPADAIERRRGRPTAAELRIAAKMCRIK
jgi:hypothetical protein